MHAIMHRRSGSNRFCVSSATSSQCPPSFKGVHCHTPPSLILAQKSKPFFSSAVVFLHTRRSVRPYWPMIFSVNLLSQLQIWGRGEPREESLRTRSLPSIPISSQFSSPRTWILGCHGFGIAPGPDDPVTDRSCRPGCLLSRRYRQEEGGTGQRNSHARKAESLHLHCMV